MSRTEQQMKASMHATAYPKGTLVNYWASNIKAEIPCVISEIEDSRSGEAIFIATHDSGGKVLGAWTSFSFQTIDFDVKVGDGIVDKHGKHWVVRGLLTPGAAAELTLNPNDKATNVVGVQVLTKDGKQKELYKGQFRRETFKEYLTRPTGFGKTAWPAFAMIQVFCLTLLVVGFSHIRQEGWVELSFFAAIEGVLMLGTWMNFKRKWL